MKGGPKGTHPFVTIRIEDPKLLEDLEKAGVKGTGEPSLGAPGAAVSSAVADALGVSFNRYPISLDQIINHLNGRPQAHKPLQINTV